jgi:hypothetical protein
MWYADFSFLNNKYHGSGKPEKQRKCICEILFGDF